MTHKFQVPSFSQNMMQIRNSYDNNSQDITSRDSVDRFFQEQDCFTQYSKHDFEDKKIPPSTSFAQTRCITQNDCTNSKNPYSQSHNLFQPRKTEPKKSIPVKKLQPSPIESHQNSHSLFNKPSSSLTYECNSRSGSLGKSN